MTAALKDDLKTVPHYHPDGDRKEAGSKPPPPARDRRRLLPTTSFADARAFLRLLPGPFFLSLALLVILLVGILLAMDFAWRASLQPTPVIPRDDPKLPQKTS